MQITLKQDELEVAVKNYIQQMGITRQVGEVTFTATRGPEGITTTVEVGELPKVTSAQKVVEIAGGPAVQTPFLEPEAVQEPAAVEAVEMPPGKSLFGG